MLFSPSSCLITALTFLPSASHALNIIVNNDDGFASASIREFYRLLKAAGHNAWIVAPVMNQSGRGGTEVFTTEAKLTAPSEYDVSMLSALRLRRKTPRSPQQAKVKETLPLTSTIDHS